MQNAGISLSDQMKVQNLIYFSEQDKQKQKQPALSADVAQLVNTFARQHPPLQVMLPTIQLQQDVAPLQPSNAPAGAKQMDTGVQAKEADQGNVQMEGNGDGSHRLGSTGPTGDAKQT